MSRHRRTGREPNPTGDFRPARVPGVGRRPAMQSRTCCDLPARSGCATIWLMKSTSNAYPLPSLQHLFAVATFGLSVAAAAVEPPASASSAPLSAGLLEQVTTLIGEAPCDSQDQCHVIGVGVKPCGGPGRYLAWSDKKTDPNTLRNAVEAQARAQLNENKNSGLVSDCRVTPMPAVVCRPRAPDSKMVCQLGLGGTSSVT